MMTTLWSQQQGCRRRCCRRPALVALLLDSAGDLERGLNALRVVHAGVAGRLIVAAQHVLGEVDAAAQALRHRRLPGALEVDACEDGAARLVDLDALHDLGQNVADLAGLHLVAGDNAVSMNRVALPDDGHSGFLDCLNVAREHVRNLAGTVPCDQHELALLFVRIELRDQVLELIVLHRGANLASDGVGNAPEVLHVGSVELARAIADPNQMGAQVVVEVANLARQRLLEVQLHGLMGSEELGRRSGHVLRGDILRSGLEGIEVRQRGELGEVDLRQHHGVHVCDIPAQEVQRGRRVPVALQQALRIPLAVLGIIAVDVLAFEGHDLAHSLDHLSGLAPRLAVLARDAADADVGPASDILHDHAHLEHHAHLALQAVGRAVHEALSAVPALHNEPFSPRGRGQQRLQPIGLLGLHQWGQRAQLAEDLGRQLLVLILGHLRLRQRLPRRGRPGHRR
mmetsp:Transcript_84839/g.182946  ORF Transcript_84839/g.182946 Transcript_84839/m.182946 type:complete len:456 (-) Transcript_84839:89-1456(-)